MIGSGNTIEPPAGPRVRIYELAKELSLGHREMVAKVRSLGIEVANHMSHLDPADVDRVRRAVTRERKESTTEERLNDTVIRRRSKSIAPATPVIARPAPTPPPAAAPVPAAPAPEPRVPAVVVMREPAVEPAPTRARPEVEAREPEAEERPAKRDVVREPAPVAAKPLAPAAAPEAPPVPVAVAKPQPQIEEPPPPAKARPEAPPPAPPVQQQPVIRTIPQQQITGSAATGAFIQLPGLTPRGEAGAASTPRIEIRDRDAEQRARGGLVSRAPAGRDRFARPGGPPGPGGTSRYGGPPRKRVAAAGKKLKQTQITTPAEHKRIIRMGDTISVSDLAQKMAIKGKEIIKKLWALGMMGVNINQDVDLDTATLIANEFGYQVESTAFNEEEILAGGEAAVDNPEDLLPRAPVVTIMGHVDHGKTSLLDAIRKANVAAGEAGGITQHIGAYKVTSERGDVVFLDTPGHEAFTAMRARGAQMTDIVVLVVAADDGPMPQTIEAINHAREAEVPIVVAINKIDKPGANVDAIRNKLSEQGLVSEEWGGDTIFVPVSAKTKEGIDKLLEMLALQAEVLELKANPNKAAKGHVVEARLDRARGSVSTILVEEGTLKIGDLLVAGEYSGKIRAMLGDKGQNLTEAGPSTPVEVLGLDGVPDAGEVFNVVDDEKAAKSLVEHRHDQRRKKELAGSGGRVSLENILDKIKSGDVKEVKVVLKADVQGSIEAIANALTKLSTDAVGVNVISSGVGGITESDVSLAKASAAIIIGFNVRPAGKAAQLAEQEGVDIKLYQVIYDAIDDVKKAMVGMLAPISREKLLGKVEVRQIFNIPKAGTIGGSFVTDGKITRKAQLRLIRDSVVIYTGKVGSLRRFKDDASEVAQGYECGISIEGYNDLREGDVIEAFEMETIAPTLDNPTGK
jgi:translation initiation factor IF-2